MPLIAVDRTRASSGSSKPLAFDLQGQCTVGCIRTIARREAAANIGGRHAMRVAAGVRR